MSTASLTITKEELRDLNHQLRTPLACILGLTNVIKRQSGSDEQRRFAQNIEISGRELLTAVENLLSKITPK